MTTTKFGLIGCGKQAEKHINSLMKFPDVKLIIADVQPALAEHLAIQTKTQWVPSVEKIFEIDDIDAVLVCTPTPSHAGLIGKALKSGKFVFCEKPLCQHLDEAVSLKQLEDESGKFVFIGYLYRSVPVLAKGLELLRGSDEQSILGKPLSAFFRIGGRGSHRLWKHLKEKGGGAINEMLVHMVDLANWYFGHLKDIAVISKKLKSAERMIQGESEIVDAEDYVMMTCTGKSGVEISFIADFITPAFTQYVEIQCENGSFMGSIQKDFPSYMFLKEARGKCPAGKTVLANGERSFLDIQMEAFYNCILTNTAPDKNRITDSMELMKIVEAVRAA